MNESVMKRILDEEVEFYTDELNPNTVYAEYRRANDALCIEPTKSVHFSAFLSYRYRELTGDDELPKFKNLLKIKETDAVYLQDKQIRLHKRVAGNMQKNIAYFLADDEWRTVKVSRKGWSVGMCKKLKFLKYPSDAAQVEPQGGGDYLKLIRPYLNMTDEDALLYAVFIVQGFSRSSSHFAAVISSSKGTGKSTLTRLTTELVDPTTTSCSLQPSSEDNLKTMLANTYVASFDNTAALSANFSNILCAAITGSKETKRKLYSNSDQIVLSLHNLVIINGIDIVPYKSDLAERSLYFELSPISKEERKTEAVIWEQFRQDRPKILGAIFDTLSKAMQILPTLQVKHLHRMADAHLEMMAIAVALGIQQEDFQRVLDANQKKLQDEYAANNPFVEFVLRYLHLQPNINMAAEKLYRSMEETIVGDRSFFPKSPSWLSRRLNEEKDALFTAGYVFEKYKTQENNFIKISRVPKSQQTKAQKKAASHMQELLNDASTED